MEEPLAEAVVFVDTNLGTRFALSIPANITAGDLKRKLKYEHSICFPGHGKIIVHSLMVRKKSVFYHIPNSMLIKEACQGFRSTWFLQIDVSMQADKMPSSDRGEINNSDFNKVPASSNSACCRTADQFLFTKFSMDRKIESSTSNGRRVQAGEIPRDFSSCEEGKVDVLSSSMKRRKLAQNNRRNAISKEAAVARQIYKSVPVPGCDSGLDVIKGDIMMDVAPCANQKDISRLSAHSQEGGQNNTCFSMEKDLSINLSEKVSVSGLILRYFSDSDEGNLESVLHRNARETKNSTLQMNNMLNIQKSLPIEESGCAAKNVPCIADCEGAYDAHSDCDTACSFNITRSETNQVCSMSNKNTKIQKDKLIASGDKRRLKTTGLTTKHNNTVSKFSTFQADNQIASARVNRKLVLSPPHPISWFSPQTPFKKSTKILSSSINKCEVGKRLVQAANKLCSSFSVKKSAMSLNPRRRNMPGPDSIIMAKRLCFEMDDSDG